MDATPKKLQEHPTVHIAGRGTQHPPPAVVGKSPGTSQDHFPAEEPHAAHGLLVAELEAKVAGLQQQLADQRQLQDDQRQQREIAMWGTSDEKAHVIAQLSEANAGLNHTLNVCCELLLTASGAMRPVAEAMRGGGVVMTPKNALGAGIEEALRKISAVLGGQPQE